VAVVICGLIALAGCDLGLADTSNRYEQLNLETKALNEVLRQISDEASANANLAALEEAAGKVRETQGRIREAEEARAEKKKGGGMGRIANARQASQFQYTGDAARRQVERIREADAKSGAIVDKAVEGIEFPELPEVAL
jgi:hypothetical protein